MLTRYIRYPEAVVEHHIMYYIGRTLVHFDVVCVCVCAFFLLQVGRAMKYLELDSRLETFGGTEAPGVCETLLSN